LSSFELQVIAARFLILVLSLSFHEAAHAWSANRLGDPTARLLGRLTLNPLAHIDWIGTVLFPLLAMFSPIPLIGWAKPVPVDMRHLKNPRRDFALIAAAGPASNLLIAAAAALIYKVLPENIPPVPLEVASAIDPAGVLQTIVVMNCLLAVFNMIPVPPLDGGNVLMGFVGDRVANTINWLRPYGFLILYVLMLTGLLGQFMLPISYTLVSWLL
jgi:Zn-dependent protease